jgi:hypothetical protein
MLNRVRFATDRQFLKFKTATQSGVGRLTGGLRIRKREDMEAQIKLVRIFGIEIGLHYSWLIMAFLITLPLAGILNDQRAVGLITNV